MPATLRDVAAAAGVHPGTASRAMNPAMQGLVSRATVRKVQRAAERLGYVPNPLARGLRTNRTHSLGVVVPDITNPLFPPLIRGIEDAASAEGFNVLVANTDNEPDREREQVAALRSRHVDGLILASARVDDPVLRGLVADKVPLVLVNRVEPDLAVSSVAGDDQAGIRLAMAHLFALGHRRIGHIAGPESTSTGLFRATAFAHEVLALGLDPADCPTVRAAAYHIPDGVACTERLLAEHPDVTAIVAANDLLALGCYDVLAERGVSCPGEVSVVGFNDMPFADRFQPPLTTIHIPHYDIGSAAAELMLERLQDGDAEPREIRLEPHLVVRDSTARPRG